MQKGKTGSAMIKRRLKAYPWLQLYGIGSLIFFITLTSTAWCESAQQWNLDRCIDRALKNSISLKKNQLDRESALASLRQAEASLLPNLQLSSQYSATGKTVTPTGTSAGDAINQSLRLGLSSSVTLFDGFSTQRACDRKRIELAASDATIKITQNSIIISVTTAYLKTLFAHETFNDSRQSLEASQLQLGETEQRLALGATTAVAVAQMKAQYASDRFRLTTAENNSALANLALKQLLELPVTDSFIPFYPTLPDSIALTSLPEKTTLYQKTLAVMPEMVKSTLQVTAAELAAKSAKAGYLPSVSASGSLSSSLLPNANGPADAVPSLTPSVGIQLSLPLYNNRKTATAIIDANIAEEKSRLAVRETEKSLLEAVETAYLNAAAARKRLDAAQLQLSAAQLSNTLVEQQFSLGMVTANDLLLEKNRFLTARNERLQACFAALLYDAVLAFYQGDPITLQILQ